MTEHRIKRGDSFLAQIMLVDDSGVPIDLSTVTLTTQVRQSTDDLVATLALTPAAATGVATIRVTDTSLWPAGLLRADIKVSIGGLIVHSDTIGIRVNRQVTA